MSEESAREDDLSEHHGALDDSVIGRVLPVLLEKGVQVSLLRDAPDQIANLTELDLLVSGDDQELLRQTLESLGWAHFDKGLYDPKKWAFVTYSNRHFLKIDCHFEIIDKALVYMPSRFVLERSRIDEAGRPVLSDADWLVHVSLHTVLGKSSLNAKYKDRMEDCLSRDDVVRDAREVASGCDLGGVFDQVLSFGVGGLSDPGVVADLKVSAKRQLCLKNGNGLRYLQMKVMRALCFTFGLRKGVSIAVLGTDGSGKTSFNEALKTFFKEAEVPVRQIYMGPWEYPILPTTKLMRWWGATPKDDIKGGEAFGRGWRTSLKRVKGLIKRYAYYANIFLEVQARYFWFVFLQKRMRRFVLCDRYVYDLLIGVSNRPVVNSPRLRRWICYSVPRPDITVFLDGDAHEIWARKKEYDEDIIASALERYRALSGDFGFERLISEGGAERLAGRFLDAHGSNFIHWRREGFRQKRRWP